MHKITTQAKIIVLALTLALGISYVSAAGTWTGPTVTPPGGNVDTPLNIGNNAQSKAGDLAVNSFLANSNSLFLGNLTVGNNTGSTSKFIYRDGNQGVGKVLVSNAVGEVSWGNAGSSTAAAFGYEIKCLHSSSNLGNGQATITKLFCVRLNRTTGTVEAKRYDELTLTGNGGPGWSAISSSNAPAGVGSAPFSMTIDNTADNLISSTYGGDTIICIINGAGNSKCMTGNAITLNTYGWTKWADIEVYPF